MDDPLSSGELDMIEEWAELHSRIRTLRAQLRRVVDEIESLEQIIDDNYQARLDQVRSGAL